MRGPWPDLPLWTRHCLEPRLTVPKSRLLGLIWYSGKQKRKLSKTNVKWTKIEENLKKWNIEGRKFINFLELKEIAICIIGLERVDAPGLNSCLNLYTFSVSLPQNWSLFPEPLVRQTKSTHRESKRTPPRTRDRWQLLPTLPIGDLTSIVQFSFDNNSRPTQSVGLLVVNFRVYRFFASQQWLKFPLNQSSCEHGHGTYTLPFE